MNGLDLSAPHAWHSSHRTLNSMSEDNKPSISELGTRVAKTKNAIDSLEEKLAQHSRYSIRVCFGPNSIALVDLPGAFTTPAVRAIQAILKQGMTLDAVTLAELVGLPPPKLSEEDQVVTIRMAQLAITDGSDNEAEAEGDKKKPEKLPERCQ